MEGIAKARRVLGWTQERLARELETSQGLVSRWEHAKTVKLDTLERVSDVTGVTLSFLLGLSDDPFAEPMRGRVYYKPVLGRISAGTPREAIEDADERHCVPAELYRAHPHGVWLRVAGNSMNRLFPDGCLVYVDLDAEVRDGDVAVVFVNGDDATVKRVYWEADSIRLSPESYDPDYRDRVIFANDPDAPEVRTLGKVVSYTAPDGWRA